MYNKDIKQVIRYIKVKFGFTNAIYKEWEERHFSAPSPHFVKQSVVLRNGLQDATWIETGTYTGSTTDILSNYAKKVISIEPEPELFRKAKIKFEKRKNIELINDISENVFPTLLSNLMVMYVFGLMVTTLLVIPSKVHKTHLLLMN
jgi:16S rRNA A1518/A1519 N6-dimethyltransferase RsmA/KsgA/DIM1 with predicted DNA glycosylase/AP lyase activity